MVYQVTEGKLEALRWAAGKEAQSGLDSDEPQYVRKQAQVVYGMWAAARVLGLPLSVQKELLQLFDKMNERAWELEGGEGAGT